MQQDKRGLNIFRHFFLPLFQLTICNWTVEDRRKNKQQLQLQ